MAHIPPKEPALNTVILRSANLLVETNQAGVESARSFVHVNSGDLQSTIRATPPELDGDYVRSGLRAGGTAPNGNDVNYAYEEELRHSYLRAAIAAMRDRIQGAG